MQRILIPALAVLLLVLPACDQAGSAGGDDAEVVPGIVHIDDGKDFDAAIARSAATDGIVVVDFWATWCGTCKLVAPDLAAIVKVNPGKIAVIRVDVDKAHELATRFKVETLPLLIKFSKGKEVERAIGYGGKEALAKWLGLKP